MRVRGLADEQHAPPPSLATRPRRRIRQLDCPLDQISPIDARNRLPPPPGLRYTGFAGRAVTRPEINEVQLWNAQNCWPVRASYAFTLFQAVGIYSTP